MTVTSDVFRSTPSIYVRQVLIAWLLDWWWVWALPLAACVIGACFNFVWVFVALMIVCLLYPGLLMMVYFNYALSPEARNTLLDHRVIIDDTPRLTIEYEKPGIAPEHFTSHQIKEIEPGGHNITITLKQPRYHHITIPISAINEQDRAKFFAFLEKLCPSMA